MRQKIRRILELCGNAFRKLGRSVYTSAMEERVGRWYQNPRHADLRFDYPLNHDSLVIDLGGYQGQWASDIYSRYRCRIMIFEPVEEFARNIQARFANNPEITVYPFGLTRGEQTIQISHSEDGSSAFLKTQESSLGCLKDAANFLTQNHIEVIDLMKINIEGGEYDLLEYLLETGWVSRIRNIQVQFHDFVPIAETRMRAIQDRLSASHVTTYSYPFVWENWTLKTEG